MIKSTSNITEKSSAKQSRGKLVPKLRFKEFDSEWINSIIDNHFEFKNGLNKEKEFFGFGTPIINFKEVYNLEGINKDDVGGLVHLSNEEIKRYNALKGDIFFTRTSETIFDIGMAAVLMENIPNCVFSGFVLRARPKNNILVDSFKKYCFGIWSVRKEIITKSSFTTRALTSGTLLKKVSFNFPESNDEQEKIAAFLSAVDEKIQQLNKKKELLEQYKKGVMQQLFSGELRFKDENGNDYPEWEEKRLKDFCSFFSGGTPSSSNKDYYSGDIPFIGSGDIYKSQVISFITEEALKNSSAKLVEKGDLLYALYGATSGESSISNINGAINQATLCIRTKQSILYLSFVLSFNKSNIISKYLQGGQGNLSANIIKNLIYNLPCLDEQQKIADYLSGIDNKIEKVKNQIDKTQEFKKGLLQQMFVAA